MKRAQPDIRAIARLIPASGNLVQGQNETQLNPALARSVSDVVQEGLNHYSFFEGIDELRRAVSEKVRTHNAVNIDADRRPLELIVTPGATGGIVSICHTYLRDSSAVVFEPYYPYHKRSLETCNGRAEVVKLRGHLLELDPDELRRVCRAGKDRSEHPLKAIVVCSPANPTGRVFTRHELQSIVDCAEEFDLLIVSDEVYEHFTLSASDHVSAVITKYYRIGSEMGGVEFLTVRSLWRASQRPLKPFFRAPDRIPAFVVFGELTLSP